MENQEKMNLTTYEWEEEMIDELCAKYKINDVDMLNIFATIILNEVAAMADDQKCILVDLLNNDMGGELIKREILKYVNSLNMDQLKDLARSMAEPSMKQESDQDTASTFSK